MSLVTLLDRNKAFAATDAVANNPQTASGLPAFRADAAAIETFAAGPAGSGKPLVIPGATLIIPGRRSTERDELVAAGPIAEAIGRHLNLPARSLPAREFSGMFPYVLSTDMPASSALTQELMDWKPTHPGLIEDIEQGHYFTWPASGLVAACRRRAFQGGRCVLSPIKLGVST